MNKGYLSRHNIWQAKVWQVILLVIGSLLSAFFAFGLIYSFLGTDEGLREGRYVYLVFLIPSLAVIWLGLRLGRRASLATRYNAIFALDSNGVITLQELSSQLKKSEEQIYKELNSLLSRNYLRNCTLKIKPALCVILADGAEGTAADSPWIDVTCPQCGGINHIRPGKRSRCEYCGSAIEGKQ